jgi:putative salt-induced outer membrane protein
MIKRMLPATLAALAAFAVPSAYADWGGQGEVGFVMARGNTDSDSANVKLDLNSVLGKWKHTAGFVALYGKSNEIKSAERWDVRWQSDYQLNDRLFVFGAVRYQQDRFSGFEYQATLSSGLGYRIIDTERTRLSTSLGAGFRKLRPETLIKDSLGNVIERIPGESADEVVGSLGMNFEHALTPNTKVIDKLLVESGSDNTFATNELSLQVSMTEKFALSVGYSVRHNTEPTGDLEKTDQLTTLNLVYKIK